MVDVKIQNQTEATESSSSLLGDHALAVKLKDQDDDSDFVRLDQRESDHQHLPVICEYCNRGFASGKALGGHKRIHSNKNHPQPSPFIFPNIKSTQHIKFKKRHQQVDIAKRNQPTPTPTPTPAPAPASAPTVPTCSICSKVFHSMKSLFGHMRSHPDRNWRGIQPPPAVKSTSSASLVSHVEPQYSDDQVNSADPVDLTKSLHLGWSVTAKRGRKQAAILDIEFLIADELMRLARGEGAFFETRKQRVFEEVDEATNSNSFAYKAESEDNNNNNNKKKKKKKKKIRSFQELSAGYMEGVPHPVKQPIYPDDRKSEDTDNNKADNETGSLAGKSVNSKWEDTCSRSSCDYEAEENNESANRNTEQLNHKASNGNGKVIIFKNKKKRKKIKDLKSVHDDSPVHEVVPATPDKYRCGTYDNSFQTHQALGVHRSNHKMRMTIPSSVRGWSECGGGGDNADYRMLEDEENKGSEEGGGSSKEVGDTHGSKKRWRRISTCEGGNKRCESVAVAAPSSQVSSVGELSHTCGGRVLDFDLNEVPAVEDEEEEGGANCGHHASSSFNSVEFPVF